jgi:signal transduction histidine kinase
MRYSLQRAKINSTLEALQIMFYRDLSFKNKIILQNMLLCFISLLVVISAAIGYNTYKTHSELIDSAIRAADLVGANAISALITKDQNAADNVIDALSLEPEISFAAIYKIDEKNPEQGVLSATYFRGTQLDLPLHKSLKPEMIKMKGHVELVRPLIIDGKKMGVIYAGVTILKLQQRIGNGIILISVVLLVMLGVNFLLSSILQKMLTKPLNELIQAAKSVTMFNDYNIRAKRISRDEFGVLTKVFNQMLETVQINDAKRALVEDEIRTLNADLERKVAERTEQFESSNSELRKTLSNLEDAQLQLVETAKMASLGGLVAGVAHEINTPLGIAVTAASHLGTTLNQVNSSFKNQTIKKSELESFFSVADETVGILTKNLSRASLLVKSFKEISVDQSSDELRRFQLRSYLEEIILSLKPKLKNGNHSVTLTGEDITVLSYPGTLTQIMTNLMLNSITHGFEGRQDGRIEINFERNGERVVLQYSDNGCGMTPQVLQKMFEPFFTTKRGDGGSGLGTSIVYNAVTQRLRGDITATSELGKGTQFRISFPLELPMDLMRPAQKKTGNQTT